MQKGSRVHCRFTIFVGARLALHSAERVVMIMSHIATDATDAIDYDERGSGPTIVLVPGSCSTGAAWRPVITALGSGFRCITTSLLGYGGTAERRTASDPSIAHEADVVEAVVRRTGSPVHLVGHSFGGLVAIAVAMRDQVPLASLVVLEAPAVTLLRDNPDDASHFISFCDMRDRYFADFAAGKTDAIQLMIDFYGGKETFSAWPDRVRTYAMQTTAVNILDWASAFGFAMSPERLATVEVPALVAWGGISHPAAQRENTLLSGFLPASRSTKIAGAAHFMIATHAEEVAGIISRHVLDVEDARRASQ